MPQSDPQNQQAQDDNSIDPKKAQKAIAALEDLEKDLDKAQKKVNEGFAKMKKEGLQAIEFESNKKEESALDDVQNEIEKNEE